MKPPRNAIQFGRGNGHRLVEDRIGHERLAILACQPQEPIDRLAEGIVYNEYDVNCMGTISARVPDELEAELEAYLENENLDRSTAVRKLLSEGLDEWRREQALDQLAAGSITFSKAAELAGMSVWEFAQLAKARDITWVAGDHLEADLEAL